MSETAAGKLQEFIEARRHIGFALKSHDRRIHLGRRSESSGRHLADDFNQTDRLRGNGQVTVRAAPRLRGQSLRNFFLHQKYRKRKTFIERQKFVNNRRGDVIRQISGNRRSPPLREVKRKHIRGVQMEIRFASKLDAQVRDEPLIDFDSMQLIRARQKMARKRSASSPDFDHSSGMLRASGGRNPFENRIANKKMLPKLARQAPV